MKTRRQFAELLAVLVIAMLIIGGAIFISQRSATPQAGPGAIGALSTAPTVTGGVGATPSPSIPSNVNPEHLTLPAGASIQSVQQVVDLATKWAGQIGATHPQVEQIRLETIKTAMVTTQAQLGQPTASALAAQSGVDPAKPVWRILLGGDQFALPSCPAPASTATPDNCGTSTSVQFIIDPLSGDAIRDTFGVQPLATATP